MFDDLNEEQNNNQVASNPKIPVVPNNSQSDKAKSEVVADIFADTEKDEKPQAFQANNAPVDTHEMPVKPNNVKKILLLLAVFCGFVLICSAGYFAYVKIVKGDNPAGELIEENSDNLVVPVKKADDSLKKEEPQKVEPVFEDVDNKAEVEQETPFIEIENEKEEVKDSDDDGLSDFEESILGTNINNADTDADGVSDEDEVQKYKTDPLSADTDNDGYLDGAEIDSGYNPKGTGRMFE